MTTSIVDPEIHDPSSIKRRIDSQKRACERTCGLSGGQGLGPGVGCAGTRDAVCRAESTLKGGTDSEYSK
jgi:hypothetical protein